MWEWLWAIICWAQLSVLEPVVRWWEEVVLGSWEEWLLALVRQGFEETTRFLNGIATWFLQLLNKQRYRDQLQRAWQENSWQQWWGQVATRPSTLNALVANLVAQQQQQQQQRACSSASQPTDSASAASASGASNGRASTSGAVKPPAVQSPAASTGPVPGNRPLTTRPGQAGSSRDVPRRSTIGGRASTAARLERPMVFVQQSGMGILDELAKRRHGLIEDAKMAAQLAVSRCFEVARSTIRAVLLLPPREAPAAYAVLGRHDEAEAPEGPVVSGAATPGNCTASTPGTPCAQRTPRAPLQRSKSAHVNIAELAYKPGAGAGAASSSMSRRGLRRSHSFSRLYGSVASYQAATEAPSDALSVIRSAGYPHELHMVTTPDGYVLRLERIPRPGARDVAFFMHGVLDTSMAWVSGGVTGSQAFAAWEAGLDVWLGNSRGNAPRQHSDPAYRGGRYWRYNINHMGMYDIAAQLDHIHNIKCSELGAGSVTLDLDHLGPLAGSFLGGGLAASGGSGTPSAAGSAGARGGAASSVFPNMSASAAQQPQRYAHASSAMAHATRLGGGRSSMRMRNSNSDGNLCRWGSTASAVSAVSVASSGAGSSNGHCNGVGDDRTEPQPSSLQSRRPALVELGAAGSSGGAGAAAGGVSAAPMASSARLCRAGSSSLTPMQSCESGEVSPGADEQERAADRHGSTLEAPPTPTPPAVYRNAVTLTLTSPRDEDSASSFSGASGIAGPSSGAAAAHLASGAEDASSPIRSTFTLEAKTRTDFSQPPHHARMSAANTSRAAAEGAAAGASAAAGGNTQSLLESMGSVLGPAAGAVSAAMASAGVALAGVAASASQLLHSTPPASPLRPAAAGASPRRAGAAGAVGAGLGHAAAGPTAASPFAARTAQLPAAAASAAPQRAAAEALSPTHPAMHVVSQSHGTPQHVEQSDQAGPQRVQHPGCATPRVHQPRDQPTTSARRGLTLSPPLPAPSSLPGFRRATSTDQLASSTAGLLLAGQGAASGRGPLFAAALQHGMTATARLGVRAGLHGYGADSGAGADPGLAGSAATSCGGIGAAGQAVPATLSEPGAAAVAADQATPPPAASPPLPPYKLRCVAHSLGGMSVLIHLVNRLREGRPHHVSRLVLLTPAGFHKYFPKAAKPIAWVLPLLARLMRLVLGRSFCFPLYIPTPLGRALTFKLLLSASRIPGLGELMRLGFKAMLDGDISQWDRALQMPHYNEEDMPAISLDQVLHLIQLSSIDCFRLYDYGSSAANRAHYGVSQPPDVSAEYWRLDMPVHLVAGRRDGIIPPANIRRHLDAMRAQGVPVSYREFDFGHLDFTFGVKEELRIYLMKLLRM